MSVESIRYTLVTDGPSDQLLKYPSARQRLAGLINDFSPLEELPAFRAFKAELKQILRQNGWL